MVRYDTVNGFEELGKACVCRRDAPAMKMLGVSVSVHPKTKSPCHATLYVVLINILGGGGESEQAGKTRGGHSLEYYMHVLAAVAAAETQPSLLSCWPVSAEENQ